MQKLLIYADPSRAHSAKPYSDYLADILPYQMIVVHGLVDAVHFTAQNPENIAGMVHIGGRDIDPDLYGDETYVETGPTNFQWDSQEYYSGAFVNRLLDKPLLGICRGSQMVCVINGGKLIQHVDGHGLGYNKYHPLIAPNMKTMVVNSTHHQVAQPAGYMPQDFELLGWSNEGYAEIVYYPKTQCLGIQCHPEDFAGPQTKESRRGRRYINHLIETLFTEGEL